MIYITHLDLLDEVLRMNGPELYGKCHVRNDQMTIAGGGEFPSVELSRGETHRLIDKIGRQEWILFVFDAHPGISWLE